MAKTIIINNAGPRGPVGPQGETGPSGSDANVPSLIISSSKQFTNITSPFTGSFTGSFAGDGSNLINVPASGVVGLNLSQISSGTATASISETGGLFVNTHITASGDISASSGTITALTGSFNHIITDDETLEFRSKTSGARIGKLKFSPTDGLDVQDSAGARAKMRAARGEFLSLEVGPTGLNSLGSITASGDISASGRFIGDGSGLTNVFENTAVSASLSTRISANEAITAKTLISGSTQISAFGFVSQSGGIVDLPNTKIQYANVYPDLSDLPSPSNYHGMFAHVHSTGKGYFAHAGAWIELANISVTSSIDDNRSLITGITSSLSTTGRMVFVGANGTLTSEAGFEYNAATNQLSVDNLNVNHLTSSFITASRIFTSGSNILGDASNDVQTLIGTTKMIGSAQVTGSLVVSGSGITVHSGSLILNNNLNAYQNSGQQIQIPAFGNYPGASTVYPAESYGLTARASGNSAEWSVNNVGTMAKMFVTSRLGQFTLANWTSGIVGVYLNGYKTEAGPLASTYQRNFIANGLVVNRAHAASVASTIYALDVAGPIMITGSNSNGLFGLHVSSSIGTGSMKLEGDAQITGSLNMTGSVDIINSNPTTPSTGTVRIGSNIGLSNLYSINFDGTDDIAEADITGDLIGGSKTVSWWMKVDDYNASEMIMSIRSGTGADEFSVRKVTGGNIAIGARGASSHGRATDMSKWDAENTLENWTHILVTKEYRGWPDYGQILKIFINGVDVSGNNALVNVGSDQKIQLGTIGTIGYYGSKLNGSIDELAVFSGHLTSSANINAIYNNGVPSDLTDLNPLVWYRMGDIVAGSGSNIPDQGSEGQGDLVLQHDAQFVSGSNALPAESQALKVITSAGKFLSIGPKNDTYNQFKTDASKHIFNKDIEIEGGITGDATSTASFGRYEASGDISTSGTITNQGTTRTLFTTASLVYSGSNVTQVTQSFGSTQQITNIIYSGSFADGNPLSIAITGSDGINKLYTLTYSASLVTQIIQS